MPITIKCANCMAAVTVPDHQAGKRVNCPRCGIMIFLPRAASPADDDIKLSDDGVADLQDIAARLEAENKDFDRLLREDASTSVPAGSVASGGGDPSMDVFRIEGACIDWLTAAVTGDDAARSRAHGELVGCVDRVPGVLKGLDVGLLLDSPLTDLPPPVLRRFVGQLLKSLGLPPTAAD